LYREYLTFVYDEDDEEEDFSTFSSAFTSFLYINRFCLSSCKFVLHY